MAEGIQVQLTHAGLSTTSIFIDDLWSDAVRRGLPKEALYVPVGGSITLTYGGQVPMSFERGDIRGFIDAGEITAAFQLGTSFLSAGGPVAITDPGDGNPIPVPVAPQETSTVALVSAGVNETRTLAVPTAVGQRLILFLNTHGGGNVETTVASAFSASGATTITMTAAGHYTELVGITLGGTTFAWRLSANEGSSLT